MRGRRICGRSRDYVRRRKDGEIRRIAEGRNREVEKRYDRYLDYG